ncbi:MAG: OmpA family protein [Flavobacteriales bacterium]|nr:OmpA family protein [Flavobacteriales bacterium]
MKERYSLLSMGVLVSLATMAQNAPNLVPNPGFEEFTSPVTTWDQLDRASGWSNANGGSCDIFTDAAKASTVGIPQNELGANASPAEGKYYAGFVAYKDDQRPNWKRALSGQEPPFSPAYQSYSEYMQRELSAPLTAGQEYDITIKVKLSSNSDRAVSGIGAYCSPVALNYAHRHFLNEKAQVVSKGIVSDKQNWTEIKGSFVADGTERFIVIGAFPAAGMEKSKAVEGGDSQRAYYFVDDVKLNIHPEPDTDGDGVIDKLDKCPQTPGLANLAGCPDGDGDGVTDAMDACPSLAGPADKQGCPDSDGDGISDNLDKCPKVPGVAAMKGCPEVSEKTKKLFEKALTGIQFETGKSTIKKVSFPILDQVVTVMNENPSYNLEVNGHTDSQGDDAANMKLSQDRAAAVEKYLEDKGVAPNRISSKGFGETMPVEDNKTAAGRAKNRRVEFKVSYME